VGPVHPVLYNPVQPAVGFEQLKHFLPEQGFQVARAGLTGLLEPALFIKTAVGRNDVQMWIKVLKVPEDLHRNHAAGHGIVMRDGMLKRIVRGRQSPKNKLIYCHRNSI